MATAGKHMHPIWYTEAFITRQVIYSCTICHRLKICLETLSKWNYSGCGFTHALQWRLNERDGVSNHQPHDCLLNGLFRRKSKKTSKLRVTGLCAGNLPVTGEFPTQSQ